MAGSAIGQPEPRSATAGFREQPLTLVSASNGPSDQFGRRNSYVSEGMADTWLPRSWTFGRSESWRSVAKSTSLALKPAIIRSASPYHFQMRLSRWAGLPVHGLV